MTIRNRDLSQFGSFIYVENSTQEIGITTETFPYVGIGTTNPRYKLDIDGDINFSGILRKSGAPFVGWSTAGVSGDNIYYADGDVGIGTTNPQYKLDVIGDASISGVVSAAQYYLGGTELVDAVLQYWDSDGTYLYEDIKNVGIGSTLPAEKLDVLGNIRATGTITGSNISADGITLSGGIDISSGIVTASQFISTATSPTPPLVVSSTQLVTNLNADFLRGKNPPVGEIIGTTDSQTLTNKTINLSSNTLTGTLAQFNTALSDDDFVGINSIQTLTNKTLTTPTISSILNSGTQTIPTGTGTLVSSNSVGVVTTGMIADGTITNTDISASAAIAITKLAASTISGVSLGNNLSNLTAGSFITYSSGTTYNGSAAITIGVAGTTANTANTLVARNPSGDFTAGTVSVTNLTASQTVSSSSDISLGGELNFTTAGAKYIDFYTDNGAGVLSSANLRLVNDASNSFHSAIVMQRGGAVTLYHNNISKLATSASGVDILGSIFMNTSAAERQVVFNNGSTNVYFYGNTTGIGMYDSTNGRGIWAYYPAGNRLEITRNTRFTGLVGLDAGQSLFFGREESFGGGDYGGNDYGYIVWDNDNNTYAIDGSSAENGCLRIGTQNDGPNSVSDNIALEPTSDLYLNPGGGLWKGNASNKQAILDSGNFSTWAQPNLGFTPVQQGGGINQGTNKIYIGWRGSTLGLQVDSTNFNNVWPISINGSADTAGTANIVNDTIRLGGFSFSASTTTERISGQPGTLHVCDNGTDGTTNVMTVQRAQVNGKGIRFVRGTGLVGDITINTSSISVNGTSDYRLKENITPLADAVNRLKNLSPCRFNFIAEPGNTIDGFLAHEVQPVVPEAVRGEKDAMEPIGTIFDAHKNPVSENVAKPSPSELEEGQYWEQTGEQPDYQGMDNSKLVPLLTAALQELVARVESLESA